MKFRFLSLILTVLAVSVMGCEGETPITGGEGENKDTAVQASYQVVLNFRGPSVGSSVVYASWIENETGENIQNLYICNRVVDIGKSLLGDDLPYWKLKKYNADLDGVTGPSVQQSITVTRDFKSDSAEKLRVCFEIDRSTNGNAYFYDRPSFIYKSDLIDLENIEDLYHLELKGWMANDTDSPEKYSQQPKTAGSIPGFEQNKFMGDQTLSYITPPGDMVTSLDVKINKLD